MLGISKRGQPLCPSAADSWSAILRSTSRSDDGIASERGSPRCNRACTSTRSSWLSRAKIARIAWVIINRPGARLRTSRSGDRLTASSLNRLRGSRSDDETVDRRIVSSAQKTVLRARTII